MIQCEGVTWIGYYKHKTFISHHVISPCFQWNLFTYSGWNLLMYRSSFKWVTTAQAQLLLELSISSGPLLVAVYQEGAHWCSSLFWYKNNLTANWEVNCWANNGLKCNIGIFVRMSLTNNNPQPGASFSRKELVCPSWQAFKLTFATTAQNTIVVSDSQEFQQELS